MANPVGFRFRPTDVEIVDHYLGPKNLGSNTSDVDEVISTVDIYSFDPWELPCKSRRESTDQVWYFFGCRKEQHNTNRGDRQSRKTKSGFWKKTGVTMDIMRKRSGNPDKIGEKRVLVFHFSKILGGSKSDWVMHEYVATFLSPPNQMMTTYTICKLMFKGDERQISSSPGGEIEHSHSLINHMNISGGFGSEGFSFSQELEDPRQFSGFLSAINNLSTDGWNSLLNHDDEEQGNICNNSWQIST